MWMSVIGKGKSSGSGGTVTWVKVNRRWSRSFFVKRAQVAVYEQFSFSIGSMLSAAARILDEQIVMICSSNYRLPGCTFLGCGWPKVFVTSTFSSVIRRKDF